MVILIRSSGAVIGGDAGRGGDSGDGEATVLLQELKGVVVDLCVCRERAG